MNFHKIILLVILILSTSLAGCSNEEPDIIPVEEETQYTLFMYLPWSSNLTSYFITNIADMESAFLQAGDSSQRLIVFFSSSPQEAQMYEVEIVDGICVHTPLKDYDNPRFTTEAGLSEILSDVKCFAPATNYSMIIGCHGMGWLPVNQSIGAQKAPFKPHFLYDGPLTRFFGGLSAEFQTDISTLSNSISHANMHMDFIASSDIWSDDVLAPPSVSP